METNNVLDAVPDLVLFSIGKSPITIGSLVAALAVAVAGFVAAGLVSRVLHRVRGRAPQGQTAIYVVQKLTAYGLAIAGVVAAVSLLGINLTSLAVFAGALGVGVGLGLQGIVKEFVSGLVLIFEGVIRVGDYIELAGGGRGEVQEIGLRATRIRNNDNVHILLPNSSLIGEKVTNWTHKGGARRIHVPFIVAYGADKDLVREAVLEAAAGVPFTLQGEDDRRSQVWMVGFADSGLKFELLVWPQLSAVKRPNAVQAAYTWAIADALAKHGIETPVPQMDLRVRSLFGKEGPAALAALGLAADGSPAASAPSPSTNDAARDVEAARRRDETFQAAKQAAAVRPPADPAAG
jgi:small-conductance mechanosensitive channel